MKAGESVTFEVKATGAERWRWYYQKPGETKWNKITKTNGDSNAYTLTAKEDLNGFQYKCIVSNGANKVESDIAVLTVLSKPVITAQPENVTVNAGEEAVFRITATDADSYQWYYEKPGVDLWGKVKENGDSDALTLTAEAQLNGYQYKCKAVNQVGTVESDVATLSVLSDIAITEQPSSVSVKAGESVTFEVKATGAEKWQWYYQKPGETKWNKTKKNSDSNAYTLTAKAQLNGYQYKCIVSNGANTVESDIAALTVIPAIVIKTQPANISVKAGETAAFKVKAANAEEWQWYDRMPGETEWNEIKENGSAATYTLTAETKLNGYQYKCILKNQADTVESNIVSLTVLSKPMITAQPVNATVNAGETAAFEVKAEDTDSYQWYWQAPGETEWNEVKENGSSPAYTLTAEPQYNGFQYKCILKNKTGTETAESDVAVLTVLSEIVITEQPASVSVKPGETAAFEVKATGADSYQWYCQAPGETEWSEVKEEGSSATYTLTAGAEHNGYQFKCAVKNEAAAVETDPVTLTVEELNTEPEQASEEEQTPKE